MSYFSNLSAVQITFAMRGDLEKIATQDTFQSSPRFTTTQTRCALTRPPPPTPAARASSCSSSPSSRALCSSSHSTRLLQHLSAPPGWVDTTRGCPHIPAGNINAWRSSARPTRRGSAARVSSAPPRFSERRGSSTISVRSVGTWTTSATRTRRSSPCPRRRMGPHQRPSAKRTRGAMPTPPRFTPPSPTASTMPSPPERFP